MPFPSRDLSDQYISLSYHDVTQRYTPAGTASWILDGLGNEIFFVHTSSLGYQVITAADSASYSIFALSASYAPGAPSISASYALSASHANQAIVAQVADVALIADTASIALNAITASISDSSSYTVSSSWSLTASFALNGEASLMTGSTYNITASHALTASYVELPHVEKGIESGSTFTGNPKKIDILFSNPFTSDIYTISVIGDEARIWSTENRSNNGFTINTNSNAALSGMIMWRAEEL